MEGSNRCKMQCKKHTKCSSPSLSNSNKATNAYGGIREEEPRNHKGDKFYTPKSHHKQLMLMGDKREQEQRGRTTTELKDLDPLCSPHLEERWIGRIVDLDLLSLFPQRYARIMGGFERGQAFPRSTMARERGKSCTLKEEEGARYLYPSKKSSCYNSSGLRFQA